MVHTSANEPLYTREQLAGLLQVTTFTLIRWERQGKLKAIRPGAGTVRYRQSDVDLLLENRQENRQELVSA